MHQASIELLPANHYDHSGRASHRRRIGRGRRFASTIVLDPSRWPGCLSINYFVCDSSTIPLHAELVGESQPAVRKTDKIARQSHGRQGNLAILMGGLDNEAAIGRTDGIKEVVKGR